MVHNKDNIMMKPSVPSATRTSYVEFAVIGFHQRDIMSDRPVSQQFSPDGEQPENRKLAHEL